MGNLGDALRRAGLVSDKDAKRQRHEERVHRKEVGRQGLAQEDAARETERRERDRERRDQDRQTEERRQRRQAANEAEARLRDLIRSHAVTRGLKGRRRFHYVDRHGRVPYILVADDVGRRLEAGEYAIASDDRAAFVIPRHVAQQVAALDPAAVLFLNGR